MTLTAPNLNLTELLVCSKNEQGYLVGNPVTGDRVDHGSRVPFLHGAGIISDQLYEVTVTPPALVQLPIHMPLATPKDSPVLACDRLLRP